MDINAQLMVDEIRDIRKTQKRFRRGVTILTVVVGAYISVLYNQMGEQDKKIKKIYKEIKELKRAKGD